MCSYSAINGTASCENEHLLTHWARTATGFQGNVVTDCRALSMSSEPATPEQSAADALNAGTDLNCGTIFTQGLPTALRLNLTTAAKLDASLERSILLLMRAGYFDPVDRVPYSALRPEDMGTLQAKGLAKEAVLQGLVLLRNVRNALPLRRGPSVTTAVIGPLANATLDLVGRYYDAICPGPLRPDAGPWGQGERPSACLESPLQSLAKRPGAVLHAPGWVCPEGHPGARCVSSTSTAGFPEAVNVAAKADQIVLFLGLDTTVEKEGHDRQTLTLPGVQEDLLRAVREGAPETPIVVVLFNGGTIAMDYTLADATLEAFKPGLMVGRGGCLV